MKALLLSLSSLLIYLEQKIQEISDPRQASNGTKYRLGTGAAQWGDNVLSAWGLSRNRIKNNLDGHQT
jgi:hypothetical protein